MSNDHYIAQFHQREWSFRHKLPGKYEQDCVQVLRKDGTKAIISVRDNFANQDRYSKIVAQDGSTLEQKIGQHIESPLSPFLKKILTLTSTADLSGEDKDAITAYVAAQIARGGPQRDNQFTSLFETLITGTFAALNDGKTALPGAMGIPVKVEMNKQAMMMSSSLLTTQVIAPIYDLLQQRNLKIMVSNKRLFLSDDPVKIMPIWSPCGNYCNGLKCWDIIISMPLGPNHLAIFYNPSSKESLEWTQRMDADLSNEIQLKGAVEKTII